MESYDGGHGERREASGDGSQGDRDAQPHRAIYAWAAEWLLAEQRKGFLKHPVIDWGCDTGYGTKILNDVLGPPLGPSVVGYGLPEASAVVAIEVIAHLDEHPISTIRALLLRAPIVIGSFPYKEPEGSNPHRRWFDLDEEDLPSWGSVGVWTWSLLDATGEIVKGVDRERKIRHLLFVVRSR